MESDSALHPVVIKCNKLYRLRKPLHMTALPFKPTRYLLIISFLFLCQIALGQNRYNAISFRIDSFASVGMPKSALQQVDNLESLARKDKNVPQQVKAAVYRMTFQSYLEEDALQAIISRLRLDIRESGYPVKPVLQSLLADMYWKYYQQNRYKFSQRSHTLKKDTDFTNWDLQTIINETGNLYKQSLADTTQEQATPMNVLNGVLEGDSTTRYLRPTLYDLLLHRALDFFLANEPAITKTQAPFSLNDPGLFADSRVFAGLTIKTTDTSSTWYTGIKYLQQATYFHLKQGHDEAVADLDLKRLEFLYRESAIEHKDSLYLSALNRIVSGFAQKPISSEALVVLGGYYSNKDSLVLAHQYYAQAVKTYPKSFGGKNAASELQKLEQKNVTATVESIYPSTKPILALLSYKNISSTRILIYKLSQNQYDDFFGGRVRGNTTGRTYTQFQLDILKRLRPVRQQDLNWKPLTDYRTHSAEFKIDSLPAGNYVMLVKGENSDEETMEAITNFRVSNIAYMARINPDDNIQVTVTDRESGEPAEGIRIQMKGTYTAYKNGLSQAEKITETGTSDANGKFISKKISSYNNDIILTAPGDTLTENNRYVSGQRDNSDDEDDEPEYKTVLFTDRQIYRPGQTIYFKALQLQTLKRKVSIVSNKDLEVSFKDVNYKLVTSLKLKTNEFGSVSGSFIIPQNMLDGEVTLETNDGDISIRVEEYKRPTFQVEFLPVKTSYHINDTVSVKGHVTALSGYGLSRAEVAYHVTRTEQVDYYYMQALAGSKFRRNYETAEIKTDTVRTDDQGNYTIKFKATPDENENYSQVNYSYEIKADVTDASGETRSGETTVTVGHNDISIQGYFPDQLFAKDSLKAEIRVNNLNGQQQKADIKVEVFALQSPAHFYKNRLWAAPDQYMLSSEEFKRDFPEYAYANEDIPTQWKPDKQVISIPVKVSDDKPAVIDLDPLRKEKSGMYRVTIKARNEKGDTVSTTKNIILIADSPKPARSSDWVIPVVTFVKPDMQAEFLVGNGQKMNVLVERYNGSKLISSHWETIEGAQRRFKFSMSANDKSTSVQFMAICQNRVYTSYQRIQMMDPDKSLKLKFTSFHNKLQPGDKEQWKLQITNFNDERQSAEMVASLYDASLDELNTAQNWRDVLDFAEQRNPNYFRWTNNNFVNEIQSEPVSRTDYNYPFQIRSYEQLSLFGYNYWGGYNDGYRDYLEKAKSRMAMAERDKQIQENAAKNAAKVKNGYLVTGKVIGEDGLSIPGVSIVIKGLNIGTVTNSAGYFSIKVPKNGSIVVSFVGYEKQTITAPNSEGLIIKLKPAESALHEVVVTGYAAQYKKELTASSVRVTLRGVRSLNGYITEDVSVGLQGRAAGLAVGADTVSFTAKAPKPQITIRKNFNETALFYPQLHTDSDGKILLDFTIPESLTKWRFKAFAHTRDLKSGYIENEVVTQKQLSISANAPRFLREGDTITVSARLANLSSDKLKGEVRLQLFNALNMHPVQLLLNPADAKQKFEVNASTNKAVSFKLVIPSNLDALTYRLTADAGNLSDGEENTIPVLPNRMLVTESMPMMIRAGQDRTYNFDKLLHNTSSTLQNKSLTLEYTQNPVWYAVQAMPYMMEFPYECAEQVFSRYYANSMATSLVNRMPVIKQVFDQWKNTNSSELLSNLENNQELKYTLLEETPWLRDATNESEQKKRIALLFDLNKMSSELKLNLDKLQQRQLGDGGFVWFGGDRSDRFITQHIVAGIGQLYHLHVADNKDVQLKQIADKALGYLDSKIIEDDNYEKLHAKNYSSRDVWYSEAHAWYARSYYADQKMSANLKRVFDNYEQRAEKQWIKQSLYEQGMVALTMLRNGKLQAANVIIKSLKETAQRSEDMGMYWGKNMQGYFWYEAPIETQCLMIELFTEARGNEKDVEEMKIWLLRSKQTSDWKTTKATAAACYALLMKQDDWLSPDNTSDIKLGGKELTELKPDIKADAGTGYIKTSWTDGQVKQEMGKVEIKNNGKSISWGALHWQYLEQLDKITPSKTDIQLSRKYFILKQTDSGPVVTEVDASHQPKTGDLLKVIVYIKAGRDFEYVQLKDMRPAGTEPVSVLSEYKYQDGLSYYEVTKDVATNFFISYLNKGNYVFEYQLRVAQPGNFSTGITTVQCMYAPEFNAHSEGSCLTVK